MSARTYRYLQGVILMALGLYLFVKIWSGTLFFYINERFLALTVAGALGFLALAQAILPLPARQGEAGGEDDHHHHDHDHDHDHHHGHNHGERQSWVLLVVALPALLGFLVPAQPLDTGAIATKGLSTNAPLTSRESTAGVALEVPADERTVLDWLRAFNYAEDPSVYVGETADVIGFVYHDKALAENQFMVGRFAITCCVADAFAIGMIVQADDVEAWKDNMWVHVSGPVTVSTLNGQESPLILADSIKEVAVPPQPYLFP